MVNLRVAAFILLACLASWVLASPAVDVSGPQIDLSASPLLVSKGGAANIRWDTRNTSGCVLRHPLTNADQPVSESGSLRLENIEARLTVSLSCQTENGKVTRHASINTVRITASEQHPLETLSPGMWWELPDSNYRNVYPTDGVPVSIRANGGIASIVDAWGGGAFDTTRERLMIMGGGHNDYWGNDIFAFDVPSLSWIWLHPYSLRIPDNKVYRGQYPDMSASFKSWLPVYGKMTAYNDGAPSANHTYDMLVYAPPPRDQLLVLGGTQHKRIHGFDLSTNTWHKYPFALKEAGSGLVSAYDSLSGNVYAHALGDRKRLFQEVDLKRGKTTALKREGGWLGYGFTAAFNPDDGFFYMLGEGKFFRVDTSNGQKYRIRGKGQSPVDTLSMNPGLVYVKKLKKFAVWNGGRNIYLFDPQTRIWDKVSPPPSSPSPGPANKNGTYGRFAYIPSKDAFILLNSGRGNLFFYKLAEDYPRLRMGIGSASGRSNTRLPEGGNADIVWTGENVSDCKLSSGTDISNAPASGKLTLSGINKDMIVTLKCRDANGQGVSASASVMVARHQPFLHYNFSEQSGSQVLDHSGLGNHGKIKGTYEWRTSADGKRDFLALQGLPSRVESAVRHGLPKGINQPHSVSMTVRVPKIVDSNNELLRLGRKGNNTGALSIASSNHERLRAGSEGGSRLEVYNAYRPGKWMTLTYSYDGSKLKVFINGKRIRVQNQQGGKLQLTSLLQIKGVRQGWFEVDDVKIWSRALSDKEIFSL